MNRIDCGNNQRCGLNEPPGSTRACLIVAKNDFCVCRVVWDSNRKSHDTLPLTHWHDWIAWELCNCTGERRKKEVDYNRRENLRCPFADEWGEAIGKEREKESKTSLKLITVRCLMALPHPQLFVSDREEFSVCRDGFWNEIPIRRPPTQMPRGVLQLETSTSSECALISWLSLKKWSTTKPREVWRMPRPRGEKSFALLTTKKMFQVKYRLAS